MTENYESANDHREASFAEANDLMIEEEISVQHEARHVARQAITNAMAETDQLLWQLEELNVQDKKHVSPPELARQVIDLSLRYGNDSGYDPEEEVPRRATISMSPTTAIEHVFWAQKRIMLQRRALIGYKAENEGEDIEGLGKTGY